MAITDLGAVGYGGTSGSGTNFSVTSNTTIPSGTLLVLALSFDNPASLAVPSVSLDTTHGTWTQVGTTTSSGVTTTAGSGIYGAVFVCTTTSNISSSATITTVTFNTSLGSKSAVVNGFSGAPNVVGTPVTGTSTSGTPSASLTANAGDLIIGAFLAEGATLPTDSDTTNGSWSSPAYTTSGGGYQPSNNISAMQNKVATASGTQTYNPTGAYSADSVAFIFTLSGNASVSSSDTAAISISEGPGSGTVATPSYDTVGPSSSGQITPAASPTNTSQSWSHTVASNANLLIVSVAVGLAYGGDDSGVTTTAAYNGVSMTSLGKIRSGGFASGSGYIEVFGLHNPTVGTNTVTVNANLPVNLESGSTSFIDTDSNNLPAVTTSYAASPTAGGSISFSSPTGSYTHGSFVSQKSISDIVNSASVSSQVIKANLDQVSLGGNMGVAVTPGSSVGNTFSAVFSSSSVWAAIALSILGYYEPAGQINIIQQISGSESSSLSLSESSSIFRPITSSDTGALAIAEAKELSVSLSSTSETPTLAISESKSLSVSITTTDAASLSASESHSVNITQFESANDSAELTISEAGSVWATLSSAESPSINISESPNILVGVASTEAISIGIAESASILVSLASDDAASITLSEAANASQIVFHTSSESVAISINENSTFAQPKSASDSATIAISESKNVYGFVEASDSANIAISETSQSVQNGYLTSSESVAISIIDTAEVGFGFATSDAASISISETSEKAIGYFGSDTSAITVSEISSIHQFTVSFQVYVSGVWKTATFKVYHEGTWHDVTIAIGKNNAWQ